MSAMQVGKKWWDLVDEVAFTREEILAYRRTDPGPLRSAPKERQPKPSAPQPTVGDGIVNPDAPFFQLVIELDRLTHQRRGRGDRA